MSAYAGNVAKFIEQAARDVGRIEEQSFLADMHNYPHDLGITSPIEQLFLVALHVMCRANHDRVNPEAEMVNGEWMNRGGVFIDCQYVVDKYRVDFRVQNIGWTNNPAVRTVLVELDGHDFHDKDKQQRSYEKARDRHLVKCGFRVLHFTGSDVVANPYKVAHEVMDSIECYGAIGAQPFDPKNPFGID